MKRFIVFMLVLLPLGLAAQEVGQASFYADKFHGRKMASGERYDIYSFTAAHRKFPFGTLLKVTNLLNRKSVMVRVEDRGPFAKNRVIDLSYAAADELGFIRRGVANVEVKEMIVRKEYLQSMTLPEKPVLIGNCRNPDNIKPVLGRFL